MLKRLLVAIAVLLMFITLAAPAFAQQRQPRDGNRRAVPRTEQYRRAVPRQDYRQNRPEDDAYFRYWRERWRSNDYRYGRRAPAPYYDYYYPRYSRPMVCTAGQWRWDFIIRQWYWVPGYCYPRGFYFGFGW